MRQQILSTIHRLGKEVNVLVPSGNGRNAFNNPETAWEFSHTTKCVRTYPNRNTQQESGGGEFKADNPVFLFAAEDEPPSNARVEYDGRTYELQSPTVYDSHVSIFGELVTG
jgi:hypothetical protein